MDCLSYRCPGGWGRGEQQKVRQRTTLRNQERRQQPNEERGGVGFTFAEMRFSTAPTATCSGNWTRYSTALQRNGFEKISGTCQGGKEERKAAEMAVLQRQKV